MLIACKVTPTERDAWTIARTKLRDAGQENVDLIFVDAAHAFADDPDVVAISLLREVEPPLQSLDVVAEGLRADARALADKNVTVFLCSIFRACDDVDLLERIRRLNLLAAELSHETGIGVIDLDRSFAHTGARTLRTDYRLGGPEAAQLAAQVIVDALLEHR